MGFPMRIHSALGPTTSNELPWDFFSCNIASNCIMKHSSINQEQSKTSQFVLKTPVNILDFKDF